MTRKATWGIAVLAGLAATAGVVGYRRSRSRGRSSDEEPAPLGPDGVVDSEPNRLRDRRRRNTESLGLGIDVDGLRNHEGLEPAVEYLTYIQVQRGDTDSHLLFVRDEDVEAIAALEGQEVPEFLERLQHLGVIVSRN